MRWVHAYSETPRRCSVVANSKIPTIGHRSPKYQIFRQGASLTNLRWPTTKSIINGIESGEIQALWVIATNPAHSWINQGRFKQLREKLDFLVVQDMYAFTETAQMADLVLPAAGWGEKDGTFINSERRIGITRKVARAPGQALADFAILKLIAKAWGCGAMFHEWSSPEAVFRQLALLSVGQPCDFSGITSYRMLEEADAAWRRNQFDKSFTGANSLSQHSGG